MTRRFSIALNILLAGFIAWYFLVHKDIRSYYERYLDPREVFLEDHYYRAKVASYTALNRLAQGPVAVLAGDSLVEQLPVGELLAGRGVLNRGVGQDTSRGVLMRLEDNINNLEISKFFLLIGHNDVKYRSVAEAAGNIELIFSKVKAREKYFISVLPTADPGQDRLIRELNEAVQAASAAKGFGYIDLHGRFAAPGGALKTGLFHDGVHPTVEGYRELVKGLENYL